MTFSAPIRRARSARPRRLLAAEALEARQLLSVADFRINEIALNTPTSKGKYVEISGGASESLSNATYKYELAVFAGAASSNASNGTATIGQATYVLDLSTTSNGGTGKLGSNGLLLVTQSGPPSTFPIDASTPNIKDPLFTTGSGGITTANSPTFELLQVPLNGGLTVNQNYASGTSLSLPAGTTVLDTLSFINGTPDGKTQVNFGAWLNLDNQAANLGLTSLQAQLASRTPGNSALTHQSDDSTDSQFPFYYGDAPSGASTSDVYVPYDPTKSQNLPTTGGALTPGGVNGAIFVYSPASYTTQEVFGQTVQQPITVTETNTSTAYTVNYNTIDSGKGAGTAVAGTNYTSIPSTGLTFPAGSHGATSGTPATKTFNLAVLDDGKVDPSLTVKLALTAPASSFIDTTGTTATVTILDGDAPSFTFAQADFDATGTGGSDVITIKRGGITTTAASVTVSTSDGTTYDTKRTSNALAGRDYTATSTVVNFAAGQTTATVPVTVFNNPVNDRNRRFNLALSNPTNGAVLGTLNTATGTVLNTVVPPVIVVDAFDDNPPSTDNYYQYIQVAGTPNATLYHVSVAIIDGRNTAANAPGNVLYYKDLSGYTLGSNGLLILKSILPSWQTAPATTVVTDSIFDTAGLPHSSSSYVVISDPQPGAVSNGASLDPTMSGTLNLGLGGQFLDGAGYTNGTPSYFVYGTDISVAGQAAVGGSPNSATRINGDETPFSATNWVSGTLDNLDNHASIAFNPDPSVSALGGISGNHPIPSGVVLTPGYPTVSATTSYSGNVIHPRESLLTVQSITPIPTGFIAQFNGDFDPTNVALYNTATPSVTLTDSLGDVYAGSLVITNANPSQSAASGTTILAKDYVTFKVTSADLPDGILPAGTYTLTIDGSDANAFLSTTGQELDGDFNGTPGGDFVTSFVEPTLTLFNPTSSAPGVVVSIPDFVAGNGQNVNVPGNTTTGIPIVLTNTGNSPITGISNVTFYVDFDGALLNVTNGTLAPGITGTFTYVPPSSANGGYLDLQMTLTGGSLTIPANGSVVFGYLTADVPGGAIYGTKEVIQINRIVIGTSTTTLPSTDSDALHLVAFPGDINGDGQVDVFDVLAENDLANGDGATAYNNADPNLVADVTADSTVDIFDVLAINDFANGNPSDTIPPINDSPNFNASGTPQDPILWVPANLNVHPGGSLGVPVDFAQTDRAAFALSSFSLVVGYDPAAFAVNSVTAGSLDRGFALSYRVDAADGLIFISGASLPGVALTPGTLGSLAEINLTARPGAAPGGSAINLMASAWAGNQTLVTSLNGGNLLLNPAPTNGVDPVDGVVTIGSAASTTASSPLQAALAAIDSALATSGGSIAGARPWPTRSWPRCRPTSPCWPLRSARET